jgi:hypothetical protein
MISQEKLYSALELISKGVTRPTKIAKAMGMTYRTYCMWMVRSNAGDEQFLVEYNSERMQWARAISLATKIALFELRGMVLQEAIYGYPEVQTFQGNVVWAPDPAASALSVEDRLLLGYREDGLLEVDGKLVPLTITRKAPWAQQIRLLEAAFPDLRPTQTVNQNVNLNGQVGVAFARPVDYSKGPPPIPPGPPMPELPAPVDAEFNEVAEPDDLEDLLGPVPVPAAPVNVNIGITVEPPVSREYSDTPTARETPPKQEGVLKPPVAYDEAPRRAARSPLEQSLFDELDKARARKAGQ